MEALCKIFVRLKSLVSLSFKKNISRSQTLSNKGGGENFSTVNGTGNVAVSGNKGSIAAGSGHTVATVNGNGNTQQIAEQITNVFSQKKSVLNTLESWMNALDQDDVYKTHKEVANLFCRNIIPFIRNHSELQPLVVTWRTGYEAAFLEGASLQKEVLQDSERTFREIVRAADGEEFEPIKRKRAEIEELLAGDRTKVGYTSWPLYREVYWGVKDLLEMLLARGKIEICSKYAILGTTPNFDEVGTDRQPGTKPCILEFTFAPAVQKAADHEKIFDPEHVQEPFVVWKYFETALYFWDIKESDIERELRSLSESDPLKALSTAEAWKEIALVKYPNKDSKKEPRIFSKDLFKKGFRTLINEIAMFSGTLDGIS